MGGTTRSTAGKRTDRPAVVRGERNVREQYIQSAHAVVPLTVPQQQSADIRIEKNGLHISLPTNITQDTLLALVNALC